MFIVKQTENIKWAGQTTNDATYLIDHKNGKSYRICVFVPSKKTTAFEKYSKDSPCT